MRQQIIGRRLGAHVTRPACTRSGQRETIRIERWMPSAPGGTGPLAARIGNGWHQAPNHSTCTLSPSLQSRDRR